jgi:hypothetical protein
MIVKQHPCERRKYYGAYGRKRRLPEFMEKSGWLNSEGAMEQSLS